MLSGLAASIGLKTDAADGRRKSPADCSHQWREPAGFIFDADKVFVREVCVYCRTTRTVEKDRVDRGDFTRFRLYLVRHTGDEVLVHEEQVTTLPQVGGYRWEPAGPGTGVTMPRVFTGAESFVWEFQTDRLHIQRVRLEWPEKEREPAPATGSIHAQIARDPDMPCPKCGSEEGWGGCGDCFAMRCPNGCTTPAQRLALSDGDHCHTCGAHADIWTWYGKEPLGPNGGPETRPKCPGCAEYYEAEQAWSVKTKNGPVKVCSATCAGKVLA